MEVHLLNSPVEEDSVHKRNVLNNLFIDLFECCVISGGFLG